MNPMLESFISESRDNLEEASQCFLALEQSPDDASIMQNLFRAMHTIKGSSGLFDIGPFTRLMHVAEDILDLARAGDLSLSSEHIDVLLNAMDQITVWIDELEELGELGSDAEQQGAPHMSELLAIIPKEAGDTLDSVGTTSHQSDSQASDHSREDLKHVLETLPTATRLRIFTQHDLATYIHYTPQADCFFTGDDPIHTVRLTPDCVVAQIASIAPWPAITELDPYACNLSFDLISCADIEPLLDHFKYVEDDTKILGIELPWLVFPSGEWNDDQSLFQDVLAPLSEHIKNQTWHAIPNLLQPVIELANPDFYQVSCLQWIKALAEKDAAEPTLMSALLNALENGAFEYDYDEQISETVTLSEANSSEHDTENALEEASCHALSDAQRTLLATQMQMLEFSTESDIKGRVASAQLVIEQILGDALTPSNLGAVVHECLESSSTIGLISLIQNVLELSHADQTQATAVTEDKDVGNASEPDANCSDEEDEMDIASLVRQEQQLRQAPDQEEATEATDSTAVVTPHALSNDADTPITPATKPASSNTTHEPSHNQKPQVLKVDQHRIDLLMDLVGELVVAKNSLPYLAKKAEDDYQVRALAKEIKSQYAVINRLAESMQSTMMQIRMVPVSTIFQRFPRLVRDLSRKLNKDVRLILEGEESEADKNVVENLADPLIHLVRNSLDHGFETEQERVDQGKSAQGTLYLRAIPKDDQVIIEVVDDGRGMDPEKLKQSAYRKGIINEQKLESITDQEALYLIFAPGFSTAEQVSDLSGRGVGMDVVNGLVQQAGGKVTIDSELGKGTTIRLFLPLTMAVSRVMMVEVQHQCFGISMENIVETVKVPHDRLLRIKQGEAIVLRDKVIPVLSLHSLLSMPETEYEEEVPLLIMSLNGEDIALKIDQFHEGIDIVQKPLAGLMSQYNYYSGSALLGDGRVLLILNIKELLSCQ